MGMRKFDFEIDKKQMENEEIVKEDIVNKNEEIEEDKDTTIVSEQVSAPVKNSLEKIEAANINRGFNVKFIKREKIVFHENNDYPQEKIEDLADLILDLGLIQNLEAFYDIENDLYVLDAGERRTRAIDFLLEKFEDYEDKESPEYKKYIMHVEPFKHGYPVNVKISTGDTQLDKIETEIRLNEANMSARTYDDPVSKQRHITKLKELYTERANYLGKDKININQTIAKKTGMTARQVIKYSQINDLIPELKEKFESAEINLNESANFSRLTELEQRQILNLIESGSSKDEVNKLYEDIKAFKKELESKKAELNITQAERDAAINNAEKIKEKMDSLKINYKKEVTQAAENLGKEEAEKLKKELEEEKSNIKKEKLEVKKEINEKDYKIAALEEQIRELEESKNPKKEIDTKVIKTMLSLENSIKNIKQEGDKIKHYYEKYINEYNKEDDSLQIPGTYKNEIFSLLDEIKNYINKL